MSFHVYPDPQTTALSIPPTPPPVPPNPPDPAKATFIAISQLTGTSVPAGTYNKMMFIRVAMFGGTTAPTLWIKAGTGTAVPIPTFTTGVYRSANLADYVGDVQLVITGEATGVFQIRMGFDQNTTETWQLGITNNDGVNRDFTWVVADSVADTAQPWIVVAPAAVTYHALVGQVLDQSVQVSNKGTGTLNVASVTPALPAGFSAGLPLAVAPAQTQSLVLTFTAPDAPPAGGLTTGTVDLVAQPAADTTAGTSAGHNQRVALTATTQQLEVVLLLDDSGSMGWDALGTPLPAGAPNSRWNELTTSANQFLDLLAHFGEKRGRFGIARFPAANPANPSTFDIVPMGAIPAKAGMKPAQDAVAAIVPTNGTPMGDGLDRVLAPATSYFGPDTFNRRWLILMSDGAQNAGTHNPLEFLASPVGTAPDGTSLAARNVELFAVAYGIDGHSDVNHVLMKQLAGGSAAGGQVRNVDDEGTAASKLAAALHDAIKSGLTNAVSPNDPDAIFVIGPGEALHEVLLTRFDTTAAFVLSWNTPNRTRLRLELITPLCEILTPENAGTGAFGAVTFRGTDRSQMYLIDPGFVNRGRDEAGGGRTRQGTWTLVVTSPSDIVIEVGAPPVLELGARVDVEHYAYDVMVDSTLRLELRQDRPTYFAGDPITVSARLTGAGRPITDASVSLSTTLPAGSVANFLATLTIPADALARAQEQLAGQDATPILVKQLAARLAGFVFDIEQRTVTIPMTDPDGVGEYRTTITDTAVPEHYTFYVTATGVTDEGAAFRREGKLETFVLVRPDPAHTVLDIRQLQPGLVDVTIVPRDRFGNVLLIDPTTPGGFGLVATGATVGVLTSNLDGTYHSSVQFDPKTPPRVGVQFGGDLVVTPAPLPVLGDLRYVDRVVTFAPGQITSANRHADPQAALGTVVDKPSDRFVSLGAGGQLTVAIKDRVVKAAGDDDITVFVAPDVDLRPYRVEAFGKPDDDHDDDHHDHDDDDHHDHDDDHHDHDHDKRWLSLGTSIGVTRSFSLAAARLRSTGSIRITDTSGRTRDANLTPLATPGVSVRGVGAKKIDKDDDDD